MEQKEVVELIAKLRDMDKTNEFEGKFSIFENLFKTENGKIRELIMRDFNRLAKEIADELEKLKEGC